MRNFTNVLLSAITMRDMGYMRCTPTGHHNSLAEMKRQLGIDRLVLQIHASSFPVDTDEDLGLGTPYSKAADRLLAFAAELGFDAIQMGPMGLTERGNPSPYNATMFSRNPINLPLYRLLEQGLITRSAAEEIHAEASKKTDTTRYIAAYDASRRLAVEVCNHTDGIRRSEAKKYLNENASWLVPDAVYDNLCAEYDALWWGDWGKSAQGRFDQRLFAPQADQQNKSTERLNALRMRHARAIEDYALIQQLLSEEHRSFHNRLAGHKLALFGDLQIGPSPRDMWAWKRLFLDGYLMGAPPSRTNPEGQPWAYSVFDPRQFGSPERPGPVMGFVDAWIRKLRDECDGVRIDHPHGWIDPWVYRSDDPDPYHAVRNGARLFSSPDETGHTLLQEFAIARAVQIDRSVEPYHDDRVRTLDEEQVSCYSTLFNLIVRCASARKQSDGNIACEILSTLIYPVRRILERFSLGRFRVAQKIRLDDPADVYRIENAQPEDWVMLSTHDTPGIWALAEEWCRLRTAAGWAQYLAPFFEPEARRLQFATECATSPGNLVNTLFAALLACRARHVLVFFPDLFGMTQRFNRPGEINDTNWMLRIPSDFKQLYSERCACGKALDIRKCLEMALETKSRAAG
jgi:4-alpha-glucanotransferase